MKKRNVYKMKTKRKKQTLIRTFSFTLCSFSSSFFSLLSFLLSAFPLTSLFFFFFLLLFYSLFYPLSLPSSFTFYIFLGGGHLLCLLSSSLSSLPYFYNYFPQFIFLFLFPTISCYLSWSFNLSPLSRFIIPC